MSATDRIKTLLKEAQLYKTQGLFDESKEKYLEILRLVERTKQTEKTINFINSVNKKIDELQKILDEIEQDAGKPQLSEEVQNLIGDLFAFSENEDLAAIEAAVALAEFGQYEKALSEFQKILDKGISPMVVAKNMLRCHLTLASSKEAMSQFKKWESSNQFSETEIKHLKRFCLDTIKLRTKDKDVPDDEDFIAFLEEKTEEKKDEKIVVPEKAAVKEIDEDIVEISSIRIQLEDGPAKGQSVDFDVTFQVGNTISFIIKANQRDLLATLKTGIRLSQIQCFSPVTFFEAGGVISERKQISSGPKQGDFSLRVTIQSP